MILYRVLGDGVARPLQRLLYRPEIAGAERIPSRGPAILAANHESQIDPFVLGMATRRPIRYMAKAELWRWPLLRQVMEAFGTFPVERGQGDALAISRARELLEAGELLGIFPQGTCLPYRERPYRRGAARLALETGAPLVPVALVGTERAFRPGRPKVGFPKLRILVGEPFRAGPVEASPEAAEELTAALEREIEALRAPFGPPAHAWFDE